MVKQCMISEQGVSEAIGFMLILSIVIAGIALVTLYGYPMLLQQQSSANERIMEKNMIVLQNDLKSLVYKTVPYKESSLDIVGGPITIYNTTYVPAVFQLNVTDCSVGGNSYVTGFRSGDLRYASGSAATDIALQNGAVVVRQHGLNGSAMLAEPRLFYDNQTNTLVLNLIGFNATGNLAREGIGTVGMGIGTYNYTYYPAVASPVCFVYTPVSTDPEKDYSVAWDAYLSKFLNQPPDISVISRTGTPGTGVPLTYTVSISHPLTLVIKKYDVLIRL